MSIEKENPEIIVKFHFCVFYFFSFVNFEDWI